MNGFSLAEIVSETRVGRQRRSSGKTFRVPRCLAIRGDLRSGRVARSGDRPQHIHFHSRANWRARWRTGSVRVWSAAMAASHSLCGLSWSRSQWIRLAVVAGLLTEPRFVDRQVSSVERQDIPSSTLLGRAGRPSVGPGGSVRRPATTRHPRTRSQSCISGTCSRHSSLVSTTSSRRFSERATSSSSGGGCVSRWRKLLR